MALFELAFVDKIHSTFSTRLNLNDYETWAVAEGTQIEPARLRRAVSSTMLVDGAHISASAYEPRKITLVLQYMGAGLDASALAVQNLARELDRDLSFLRYRPSTTNPVYFRIRRSDFTDLVFNKATRKASVELWAKPFAYGEPDTSLSFSVSYDPANTNGLYADVTDIKGDVPTPVILRVDPNLANLQSVIATWRREPQGVVDDPANIAHLAQMEDASYGPDTALQTGLTAFSGGSGARITFAGTPSAARASGLNKLPPGRYRAFLRFKKNTGTDTFNFFLKVGATTSNLYSGSVYTTSSASTTNPLVIDLGLFNIPFGGHPTYDGISGIKLGTDSTYWELWSSRGTGTGTVDVDYLLFVPADDQLSIISWGSLDKVGGGPLPPSQLRWDSYNRVAYAYNQSLGVLSKTPASIVGNASLHLSPGVNNRIYVLPNVAPGGTFSITDSGGFFITYYPRYLHVRPVST